MENLAQQLLTIFVTLGTGLVNIVHLTDFLVVSGLLLFVRAFKFIDLTSETVLWLKSIDEAQRHHARVQYPVSPQLKKRTNSQSCPLALIHVAHASSPPPSLYTHAYQVSK